MTDTATLDAKIRTVLHDHGRLNQDAQAITPETDLYQAGLTSHASVNLMLALEDAFELEFPERMLRRKSFESVAAIRDGVEELLRERGA